MVRCGGGSGGGGEVLDDVNGTYPDSVLLIARILGGHRAATDARLTAVDAGGVGLVATVAGGEHACRVAFAETLTEPDGLTVALLGLITRARTESGEPGVTSAERMMAEMSGIRTFLTRVVAVADVHPHLRLITFGGGDLDTFAPLGPDTFLYVLLPPPGRAELTIGRSFTWEAHRTMPEAERPVGAYYTVRSWRPADAELDMLFVLHGDTGPASAWAGRAAAGDPVALWGPRTSYHPPAGTDRWLLVADETGLPGVATILESLPAGTPATVIAEVAGEAEHQDLPESPSFEVTWLHRDGADPGTTTLLADAVRALPWPDGTPYVWGGGESRAMTAVRKHVRHERGLPRDAVSLVGYWRHPTSPDEPDDD